ncbi:MAG: ATP-binding cassette domain-containing protein [archaeon]
MQQKEKPIIEITNVIKEFKVPLEKKRTTIEKLKNFFKREERTIYAVNGINLKVDKPEIIGYIGKNGAGKSTTIKLLTGILQPTTGEISVLGYSPYNQRYDYTYNIGVVFGARSLLNWHIPVIESLKLFKEIYEVSDEDFEERIKYFSKALNIDELLPIQTRKLSLGQRMKCNIVASLLHNPKVLFLDEPTIGLDMFAKSAIRDFLKEIHKKYNTTIILTTHDLDDIEELCSRVVIIDNGKIIYDDNITKLKKTFSLGKLVRCSYGRVIGKDLLSNLLNSEKIIIHKDNILEVELRENTDIGDFINLLNKCVSIIDINISDPDLEYIIRKIYSK